MKCILKSFSLFFVGGLINAVVTYGILIIFEQSQGMGYEKALAAMFAGFAWGGLVACVWGWSRRCLTK